MSDYRKYRIHGWAPGKRGNVMSFTVELYVPDEQSVHDTFVAVFPHIEYSHHYEVK